MKISFHKLKSEIEISIILCFDNFMEFDNIWMIRKSLKEGDLAECSLEKLIHK